VDQVVIVVHPVVQEHLASMVPVVQVEAVAIADQVVVVDHQVVQVPVEQAVHLVVVVAVDQMVAVEAVAVADQVVVVDNKEQVVPAVQMVLVALKDIGEVSGILQHKQMYLDLLAVT